MGYEDFGSTVNGVLQSCRRFADRPAVWDDEVRWTYAELGREVLAAVRGFLAWGVRPGDRIGLCASNSAHWMVAALGIQGAGGVLVPLNTRFKGAELRYILERSGASGVLLEGIAEREPMIREAGAASIPQRWLGLDDAEAWRRFLATGESVSERAARAQIASIVADDVSDILFTSGTTGYPKGVMFTHGQSLRAYGELGVGFGFRRTDRFLLIPPFFHALGYKSGWFAALLQGGLVLPERRFEPRAMTDRVARDRVTMMIGPPTIFNELLAQADHQDLSSLRLAVPSATNVSPELVRRMRDRLGIEVLTGYGLTESSAICTYARAGDDPELVADSVGRPAPGVVVTIVNDDDVPLPVGQVGNILVAGYVVMPGYWDDPEATEETLTRDGRLRTGDLGSLDEHGFLRITGRKKDVILVGGFNVYPAEVERLLLQHTGVAEVAVVGVSDARLGEVPCAFVVPVPGVSLSTEECYEWARGHMANFKVPRRYEIVAELPKNSSMKIIRAQLRERGQALVGEAPSFDRDRVSERSSHGE
jgi:acyl-CoA synthetase (AMP-forming)/AMP-acid ligase II